MQAHDLELVCEMDEQWSSVGKQSEPRWLWYAWSPHLKCIFAYAFGRRTEDTLTLLLERLKGLTFRLYCTDHWGAYQRLLPCDRHLISKRYTQSIERQTLTLRTRLKRWARRTLCFSKPVELHDKVIGTFINRYCFQI